MECKCFFVYAVHDCTVRINRYIMECKCVSVPPGCTSHQNELIDTLWNVNESVKIFKTSRVDELIDTLWNVNSTSIHVLYSFIIGINRYIMECKCAIPSTFLSLSMELIDTLWNVNYSFIIAKK